MTHTTTSGLLLLSAWAGMMLTAGLLSGCGSAAGTPAASVSETASDLPSSPEGVDAANEEGVSAEQVSQSGADVEAVENEKPAPAAGATDEVLEVTFEDLKCGIQADVVFREWMLTERARELDGRRIRLIGFMLPDVKQEGIAKFVLLRNTECKFGPGGQADHLIQVALQGGVTASYKGDRPLEVVGRLKINPFQGPDGNTWCIYDMAGESVEWKRR